MSPEFFFVYFLTGLFEYYFLNICGVSLQILVSKREYLLHKQEKLRRLLVDIVYCLNVGGGARMMCLVFTQIQTL